MRLDRLRLGRGGLLRWLVVYMFRKHLGRRFAKPLNQLGNPTCRVPNDSRDLPDTKSPALESHNLPPPLFSFPPAGLTTTASTVTALGQRVKLPVPGLFGIGDRRAAQGRSALVSA